MHVGVLAIMNKPARAPADYLVGLVEQLRVSTEVNAPWNYRFSGGSGASLVPRWSAIAPSVDTWWPYTVPTAFLRGDLEEASNLTIESMTNWNSMALFTYRHAYPYKVVAEQPAVAAQLAALEESRLPGREAVQAYIEENE